MKRHFKPVLIITGLILGLFFISLLNRFSNELRAKEFISQHQDAIIWDQDINEFLKAIRDRLLAKDLGVKVYTIEMGDNYWKIANENNVDIDTILGCNPHITSLYSSIGERIVAINKKGVLHYVQGDENLYILSRWYSVEESDIKKHNRIGLFRTLRKGDIVFIPNARPRVFTEKMYKNVKLRRMFVVPTNGWVAGRGFGMQMHPILKKMRFHKGIDMKAPKGTPVFAAADGVVVAASQGGGYGKFIKIDHQNGYMSVYAHLSKIYVRTGSKVKQRECIGRVGDTGMVTVAHLHFEIRKNNKPINPMKFLW
ncbi:MAG: M23 family metallopeptidase [Spirochaetes bacterium]|nr:M23 family metallopeptidase [Spirochaetota bacterium]